MPGVDFGFMAHHSRERPDVMLAYVQTMAGEGLAARFGANTWLPRVGAAYVQERLSEWSAHADYAFADPEVCRMELPFAKRGRAREEHSYLGVPNPVATRSRFVDAVLRSQAAVGATMLVTPHLVHGVSGTSRGLNATLDFARRASRHPLAATHRLLFAFEATEGVFASDAARDSLLNQLVELEPGWLYLRMRVRHPISRAQYANGPALRGLRLAVESLSRNGWEVVLPQSGLAGWLMLGCWSERPSARGRARRCRGATRPEAAEAGAILPCIGTSRPTCWASSWPRNFRRSATSGDSGSARARSVPRVPLVQARSSTPRLRASTSCGGARSTLMR